MVVVGVPVSAVTAADPVTSTCRPSPARLAGPPTTPRIARTAAVSALGRLFAGGVAVAVHSAARAEVIAVISPAVRPLPRANTTNAVSVCGWPGPSWEACWSCSVMTRVEGAEAGRLAALLLLVTPDRLLASGNRKTTATSQATSTGQRSRRSVLANPL